MAGTNRHKCPFDSEYLSKIGHTGKGWALLPACYLGRGIIKNSKHKVHRQSYSPDVIINCQGKRRCQGRSHGLADNEGGIEQERK